MNLKAYIISEVRDRTGRLILFKKKEANSLVKNFVNCIYPCAAQATLSSVTDTGGTSRTIGYGGSLYPGIRFDGADNVGTNGLVVGSGTAAVAVTDTKLQTQINSGDISNTLHYLVEQFTTPATASNVHSFTTSRGFTNNSGAPITVNEVGMYARTYDSGGSLQVFLVERTLMTFTIAAGATGTVTYTIQVSV